MTGSDDSTEAMTVSGSSASAADRLLAGEAAPGDPAVPESVGWLLAALRSPTTSDGAGEQEAVASIAAAVRAAPTRLDSLKGTHMNSRRISARAASLATALVLVGATAAAATGSLPDAAQSTVAAALSHVNVDVPNPDSHESDRVTDSERDHRADAPVGPDAAGPAQQGLCVAWAARNRTDADRGESATSTAFTNLRRAARADGQLVKEYCADVLANRHDNGQPPADRPKVAERGPAEQPSTRGSGASGQDHGRQGDDQSTPVGAPDTGGIGTGSDASDNKNVTGTDHAAPEAEAGSDNASTPRTRGSAGRP